MSLSSRPRSGFKPALWPLGLFLGLSLALFGIPVLGHLGTHVIASDEIDSSAFMWFLAWWPHALAHGLNPFETHALFYPDGFNLQWAASMPLPSIVLAPVTAAFGPVVTWNVMQLLTPALSAWTAFLLCRHVAGRTLPSLVGGYLFGFSPYVLAHLTGSPNLGLVALVPVFVLLVLKRLDESLGEHRFVIAMTLALAAQYLISTEVLLSSAVFGGLALVIAFAAFAERRRELVELLKLLAVSFAATAVLVSPFLYYLLFGHQDPPGRVSSGAGASAFVLPRSLVALSLHAKAGVDPESYLGLPLIVLASCVAWTRRRRRETLVLVGAALLAAAASLARQRLMQHVPLLRYAIPVRFVVFAMLPMALIVAIGLAEPSTFRPAACRRSRVRGITAATLRLPAARWGLALMAIAFIVPRIGGSTWNTPTSDPPFFQHNAYRAYLTASDHVLTVPAWGPNQRWIAEAGIPFALSAGYASHPFPASYTRYATWQTLLTGRLTSDYASQLRRFVAAKSVTAVVVDKRVPGPWTTLFGTLGVRAIDTGGVLLYRLGR